MKKFCGNCGSEMIKVKTRADKIMVPYRDMELRLGDKCNTNNGKIQYGYIERCKNKKWYNNCDVFIDENQELFTD